MEITQARSLLGAGVVVVFFTVFILVFVVLGIVIWWKIFSKAGYNGAMGLLMLIPIVNLIMLLVLAFGEWPIYKELKQLRSQGFRTS